MASANASSDPEGISDADLQAFFVLRKPEPRKIQTADAMRAKARRKIDLSQLSPNSRKTATSLSDEDPDAHSVDLCMQTFSTTWSKIECSIKECLQKLNLDLFEEVRGWTYESFDQIKFTGLHAVSNTLSPYPLTTDGICRQIFTALILTKNIEFVDDQSTFRDLGQHLSSSACHVANLSSSDVTSKRGISGCLKSMLKQLITSSSEANSMTVLASWYCEKENNGKPVVLIIDSIEQCCGSVLAAFISILSEWVIKIPIILVFGVATTIDALRNQLPSDSLKRLNCFKFSLPSPSERMNAIVGVIFGNQALGFTVGHDVAVFLRKYFSRHDGTITAFIRALKIACVKHYSSEPLSFLSLLINDEEIQDARRRCESLPESKLKNAFNLPSCRRNNLSGKSDQDLVQGLIDLWRAWKSWTCVLMCMFEVGRIGKMQLLDIFCEASAQTALDSYHSNGHSNPDSTKGMLISQAIQKVREISPETLSCLLETWANHTSDIDDEIHEKVRELQSLLKSLDDGKDVKKEPTKIIRMPGRGGYLSEAEDGFAKVNEKAAVLLKQMVGEMLKSIEYVPFHEIFVFKHVGMLRLALTGDLRKTIHFDLVKSPNCLPCQCCRTGDRVLRPCMHDTSIMYQLTQEHGDFINLHDWYHSFKTILTSSRDARRKVKGSSTSLVLSDASIQARFCRAVSELQIAGLLRMPSKRRLDQVQRLVLGFENV